MAKVDVFGFGVSALGFGLGLAFGLRLRVSGSSILGLYAPKRQAPNSYSNTGNRLLPNPKRRTP